MLEYEKFLTLKFCANNVCSTKIFQITVCVCVCVSLRTTFVGLLRLLLAFQRQPLYALEMSWELEIHSELREPPTSALL